MVGCWEEMPLVAEVEKNKLHDVQVEASRQFVSPFKETSLAVLENEGRMSLFVDLAKEQRQMAPPCVETNLGAAEKTQILSLVDPGKVWRRAVFPSMEKSLRDPVKKTKLPRAAPKESQRRRGTVAEKRCVP